MDSNFNNEGFCNFRSAHHRTNKFLAGVYVVSCTILAVYIDFVVGYELQGVDWFFFFSFTTIYGISLSRVGYKLAKFIVGYWFEKNFGENYSKYRRIEKMYLNDIEFSEDKSYTR